MALWKETGSNPSPSASGTPAASGTDAITELHGKSLDRALESMPSADAGKRSPARVPGVESVIAAELAIEGKIVGGGELQGNVDAAKQLDVLSKGVVVGDVKASSITVAAGARMRGHVEFGWDEKHSGVEHKGTPRLV